MKTGPSPGIERFGGFGAEGISFDEAEDGLEVIVGLDGEGFEAALVEGAKANGFVAGAPALGVGECEPLHEGG